MFLEIFSASKPFASASYAVCVRAVKRSTSGTNAFLVNFTHMSQQTTAVGKARVLLAGWLVALVRTFMLVHVLVPFARSSKGFVLVATCCMSTDDLVVFVARWFSLWTCRVGLYSVAWRWNMSVRCHGRRPLMKENSMVMIRCKVGAKVSTKVMPRSDESALYEMRWQLGQEQGKIWL